VEARDDPVVDVDVDADDVADAEAAFPGLDCPNASSITF
jgi:hypothetical protein